MTRFPRNVGGRLLLALTLAPTLCAGTRLSLAAAGATLLRFAAGDPDGSAAAAVAESGGSSAVASSPAGYTFPMMWVTCGWPELAPRPDCEPDLIADLADQALRGYVAEGCDPEPEEAAMCPEPEAWETPPKLWSVKLDTQYRQPGAGRARDVGRNQGEAFEYALGLDRFVCYTLSGYRHVPAHQRDAWLYNRLLEAARIKQSLEGTRAHSDLLRKLALRKESLAAKAGRRGEAGEARRERGRVDHSLELADNALGRFNRFAQALLTCMGPGTPVLGAAAPAEPAAADQKNRSRTPRGS
jgi:hypothetical protein